MDSERFDSWTKRFAQRMSRRAAVAGLGAATVASLAAPRGALGQDDDDDQNGDDDQNMDDQSGDDTPDDNGADDTGGDDPDADDLDSGVCQPLTQCVRKICRDEPITPDSPACQSINVGPIPGGPYAQKFVIDVPPCTAADISMRELEDKCNAAYPCDEGLHSCNNECAACSDFSLPGWCH